MDGLRTKEVWSGTSVNYETQGIYEMGNIVSWKTWHGSPHVSTKGGGNKVRIYTSIYVPGKYSNTKAKR